jgi:Ca-activated chloride channel family protein
MFKRLEWCATWILAGALGVSACGIAAVAQTPVASVASGGSCTENAIIVFDASGSMAVDHRGAVKIDTARAALNQILPDVTAQRRTGLITYAGCSRVELRVAPARDTSSQILAALFGTRARGNTPLTRAVALAHRQLEALGEPGTIVLVTDGLESCSGKPCQLARRLSMANVDIKIHVIGFALTPEVAASQMTCLTKASGGTYVHTDTIDELKKALQQILGCPMLSMLSVPR